MTTNYPTSIDTFVNPTSNDSLNSPSHSQQHTNLNDAMVAVQTKLGAGNADKVGSYLVINQNFTSYTSVILDNIFTTTYDNYRFVLRIDSITSAADIDIKLYGRAGGSDLTTGYSTERFYAFSATIGASNPSNTISMSSNTYAQYATTVVELNSPKLARRTMWLSQNTFVDSGGINTLNLFYGGQNTNDSWDGLKVYPSAGSFTGNIKVYGYRNS